MVTGKEFLERYKLQKPIKTCPCCGEEMAFGDTNWVADTFFRHLNDNTSDISLQNGVKRHDQ